MSLNDGWRECAGMILGMILGQRSRGRLLEALFNRGGNLSGVEEECEGLIRLWSRMMGRAASRAASIQRASRELDW